MPLHIYEEPRADGAYVYGLDPAEGKGGGDPAALVVMDAHAEPVPRQVALFRSRSTGFSDLALLCRDLHESGYKVVRGSVLRGYERSGGLAPEANVQEMMTALGTGIGGVALFEPEYFYQQHGPPTLDNPDGIVKRPGYRTMGGKEGTKTLLLDTLREALESRAFQYEGRWLGLESMYWNRQNGKWTFSAPSVGMEDFGHGDVSVAQALAVVCCMAVREWIQRRAVAQMGPHRKVEPYYDWSKWMTPVGGR